MSNCGTHGHVSQVDRGVHVAVVMRAAFRACPLAHRQRQGFQLVPTRRAGLAASGSVVTLVCLLDPYKTAMLPTKHQKKRIKAGLRNIFPIQVCEVFSYFFFC